jgi:NADH-quinone oxidoreductase subunit K
MALTLGYYLVLSALLFTIGIVGLLIRRQNLISVLLCIELLLLAVNINFVAFSAYTGTLEGQIYAFFVLTVAAAEAAIGLALVVVYFRKRDTIALDDMTALKG